MTTPRPMRGGALLALVLLVSTALNGVARAEIQDADGADRKARRSASAVTLRRVATGKAGKQVGRVLAGKAGARAEARAPLRGGKAEARRGQRGKRGKRARSYFHRLRVSLAGT